MSGSLSRFSVVALALILAAGCASTHHIGDVGATDRQGRPGDERQVRAAQRQPVRQADMYGTPRHDREGLPADARVQRIEPERLSPQRDARYDAQRDARLEARPRQRTDIYATPAEPGRVTAISLDDARFERMVPDMGADSPEVALLRHDPQTGHAHLLHRFPANFRAPLHYHESAYSIVVLRGQMTVEHNGERHTIRENGYLHMPAGTRHQTSTGNQQTLALIISEGPWDVHWLEGQRAGRQDVFPPNGQRRTGNNAAPR